ncbi:MAG: 16S rRNA (uracil(1498)-N(3))-methyltransferase [Bacteroidales bacterium]|nr:16S rRNA (uracil(1498)-N(3))-methyltransferase [Bacteroidales bacterium]
MELFYSSDIEGDIVCLGSEESSHCTRVLRHRPGDEVYIIDGRGTLLRCRLESASSARIIERTPSWNAHPYDLTIACCPTKNNDRYEWFVEKAVEIGVDRIVPVIGEHSERKVYKTDRARRIAVSAAKQSLKAAVPLIDEAVSVLEFIESSAMPAAFKSVDAVGTLPVASAPASSLTPRGAVQGVDAPRNVSDAYALKLIACCFEGEVPRTSVVDALRAYDGWEVVVLIGPEGDFSPAEVSAAVAAGFVPIHLGPSRLRTETAAITAAEAVYLHYL